jgi:hypothetical protein
MPLEQVKELLRASDAAARNEVIVAHLRAMGSQLLATQQTVAPLRTLLEEPPGAISVEYRFVGADRVLAIAEEVAMDALETWWGEAFDELHAALGSSGLARSGPDGALYSSELDPWGRGS